MSKYKNQADLDSQSLKKRRRLIKVLIMVAVLAGLSIITWRKFDSHLDSDVKSLDFDKIFSKEWPLILVVTFLAYVNWGIESFKWKLLISRVEKVSFIKAYKSVLTGLSYGFVTPRSVGDYVGRMLHLKIKYRSKVVGALVMSRIAQLMVTLSIGSLGLAWFLHKQLFQLSSIKDFSLVIYISMAALTLIFIVFRKRLMKFFLTLKIHDKIKRLFEVLSEYSRWDIVSAILLSLVRYVVFSFQFLLILKVFGVRGENIELFSAISLIFLAKTVFFSFNIISDLGVREVASVLFIQPFDERSYLIIASSLVVWVINILLPSLIGAFFTFETRLKPQE